MQTTKRWQQLFFKAGIPLFILFAVLQLNDPDAMFWFLTYTLTSILCLLHILRIRFRIVALGTTLAFVAIASSFGSGVEATWIGEEIGRESLGLLICSIWTLAIFVFQTKQHGFGFHSSEVKVTGESHGMEC